MKIEDDIFTMHKMLNVPVSVYKNNVLAKIYPEATNLPIDIAHTLLANYAFSNKHEHAIAVSHDYVFYAFINIKEYNLYVFIGPAFSFDYAKKDISDILRSINASLSHTEPAYYALQPFTKITYSQFVASISFFNKNFNHTTGTVSFIDYSTLLNQSKPTPLIKISSETSIEHFGYQLEHEMLLNIEQGNPEGMLNFLGNLSNFKLGIPQLNEDTMSTLNTIFTLSCTLASRSAHKGGLSYDISVSLCHSYINAYRKVKTYLDFNLLFCDMMIDFAQRVAELQIFKGDSLLVNKVKRSIAANLSKQYTLKNIANELHMSPEYISSHFSKATNQTISEYINETKIKQAQRLLKTTSMPIADISASLGYSSQNYFHKVFKQIAFTTPKEYRENIMNGLY